MIQPAFEILNQRGTPMFFSDVFANRPTAGIVGRIFISIDTAAIYRDTGTTWDLIADGGSASVNIYNSNGTLTGNRVVSYNSNYLSFTGGQTFFGSQTTSTGLVVINNGSSDAHLQVVGSNAPSIRIDNAGFGATRRFVMGLATATNNFIQGATAGDICISTASASPLLFGMWQSINASEVMRITTSNNISIGYNVDLGYKLYVNGAIGTNGAITIGNGGSGTSYLYALSGSDLILNAGGDRITIRQTGNVIINNLSGSGTRMVVADASGVLSTQSVPSGTIGGTLTTNYVPKATGSSTISDSAIYDLSGNILIGSTTNSEGAKLKINSGYLYLKESGGADVYLRSAYNTNQAAIQVASSNDLVFVTNNVDRTIIKSSGNVCIGSSSEGSTSAALSLSIGVPASTSGGLQLWAATNQTHYVQFGDGTTGGDPYRGYVGYTQTSDALLFGTSSSERARFSNVGNFLIGTTTDAGIKLDVNGTGIFRSTLYATSNFQFSGFIQPLSNVGYGVKSANGIVLQEWYNGTTYNYGGFYNPSGIIAVGTTTNLGGGNLEVQTNGVSAFTARSSSTTGANGGTTVVAVRSVDSSASYWANAQYNAWDHIFANTGSSIAMTLKSSGNLLIGTTTDAGYRLQVNGTNGAVAISGSGYVINPLPMLLGTYTSTRGYIQVPDQGAIEIWKGSTSEIAKFKNNGDTIFYGNVGINEVAPTSKLQLNGTLRIDGQTAATAGGSSGQHLIINCDGTTYKIALLNN